VSFSLGYRPAFVVVDLANMVKRCVHVKAAPLLDTSGKEIGHIYRFIKSLMGLRRHGGKLVFALEGGKQEQKYELHAGYKSGRGNPDSTVVGDGDLVAECMNVVPFITGYIIQHDSYEADDVIASFIHNNRERPCLIVSNDHDLWYLLKYPTVKIQTQNGMVDADHCASSFFKLGPDKRAGCLPKAVPLAKALFGDKSDTIPGIRGLRKDWVLPFLQDPGVKHKPATFFEWADGQSHKLTKAQAALIALDSNRDQVHTMFKVTRPSVHVPYTQVKMQGDAESYQAFLQSYGFQSLYNTAI
jgi:5'-3' exonuclease